MAPFLRILGIETSCDETAASIVVRHADGRGEIVSDVVVSAGYAVLGRWREEYERERAQGGEARVFEALETKLQTLHQRRLDSMSPRARAAWDAFKAIEAEDEAAGYRWWEDPEHPLYEAGEEGGLSE